MIVYTGGTFDVFHAGHVDFLKQCSLLGDVVVSVNTDEFVERYKGKKPVNTLLERMTVLEACKYVDKVIVNTGNEDSKESIYKVKPDYIVIGSDWLKKDYCKQMNFNSEWLEEQNIALVYIPRVRNLSSTQIKERVKE
jgi:glycerol-3-phosphate cytidylyltransferase